MENVLLVHAPALGPMSWEPVRRLLTAQGCRAAAPDLRSCLTPADRWWDRAAREAVAAAGDLDRVVVAGHSGAGVLLPMISHRLGAGRVVFVDAQIPARSGRSEPGAAIREFARSLTGGDGRLPPWSTWWGQDVMTDLVPDDQWRHAIEDEQVRLPGDFYEQSVPVPPGWPQARATYIQLSPAYDEQTQDAADRGWAVERIPGRHLDLVRRPAVVAAAIMRATSGS